MQQNNNLLDNSPLKEKPCISISAKKCTKFIGKDYLKGHNTNTNTINQDFGLKVLMSTEQSKVLNLISMAFYQTFSL